LKIKVFTINKINTQAPELLLIENYLKRLPWQICIEQLELKGKFPSQKQKALEGELLLKAIDKTSYIIALDESGSLLSSQHFAQKIEKIDKPISFIIGGAYGLSAEVKTRADSIISLSLMTMPHIFARLFLVEQIYRAYTIISNHPYHK